VTLQFFLAYPQRSLCVLLGHSALVYESFELCMLLGTAFCAAHRALLNVESVCKCKLVARIDLLGLRWNASPMQLTFSSEAHVFPGDFRRNRLPAVLSLLSQNIMLFRVECWRLHRVLKRRWLPVRDRNSARHNTH
jgi:hypothetical protein